MKELEIKERRRSHSQRYGGWQSKAYQYLRRQFALQGLEPGFIVGYTTLVNIEHFVHYKPGIERPFAACARLSVLQAQSDSHPDRT